MKGYQDENIKAIDKQRDLEAKLKQLNSKYESAQNQIKEYQLKNLKKKGGVYIEEDEEVNM